ncbi:MAG TPA: hypothetical protein VGM51_02950 [Armatimonadota bacterium]|jgi:hypothetical protein
MYLVISHWEPLPGRDMDFERTGPKVREALRSTPGVEFMEAIKSDGKYTAVHGYKDEATYHAVVDDPNGPFSKALADSHLEDVARWVGSERGETIPH